MYEEYVSVRFLDLVPPAAFLVGAAFLADLPAVLEGVLAIVKSKKELNGSRESGFMGSWWLLGTPLPSRGFHSPPTAFVPDAVESTPRPFLELRKYFT